MTGTLKIYEIQNAYIDYLSEFAPHLFHNKKVLQSNERKYIGIILKVNEHDYFAPLSSFKQKHYKMKEGLDFIKIKTFAVINLNNMFPVPKSQVIDFDIKSVKNPKYKELLQREYRIITSLEKRIIESAEKLYNYKIENKDNTPLAKRCNDFLLLEQKATEYKPN